MAAHSLFDLSGQVAWVTGATKGIGLAIAQTMAAAGAHLVVTSRRADACEAVVRGLRHGGAEAISLPGNISHLETLENLVASALAPWGRIDCLVLNAAINPYFGPLAGIDEGAFDKIMTANVKSALLLCNKVIPGMAKRGGGSVIIVSSIAGLRGHAKLGAYSISKAANMQLVRALAVEWGPKNIRVNGIAPGLVKTDMARALWQDERARNAVLARYPLGRLGEPEDIAGAAVFLAARAGAWVTGQTLVVDGGTTIMEGE